MSRLSQPCCTFLLMAIIVFATSCATNKKITYFKDVPDSLYTSAAHITGLNFSDPLIQPNDILQISILTLDPAVNNVLTTTNTTTYAVQAASGGVSPTATSVSGFLVDRNGEVELPIIGKVKVGGLTTASARDTIHGKVASFYKGPVVNVRFANFNITVLGEVARPATYVVPSEKVSILDAIGMAGDLTIFGRRENVLLVRDSAGVKQMVRFNLNSSETFKSPYFYLRQGDMVYIEPNKSKVASTDAIRTRNITIAASVLTVLITLVSRL